MKGKKMKRSFRRRNEDVDGVENVIGDDYVSGPDGNNESISCLFFLLKRLAEWMWIYVGGVKSIYASKELAKHKCSSKLLVSIGICDCAVLSKEGVGINMKNIVQSDA